MAADLRILVATLAAAALGPPLACAQEAPAGGASADELAKQLSNPVAALISVPLQLNYDEGFGTAGDDDRADVNATFIQPFLAKAYPGGRTVTLNLESSYDFEGKHWNVPVNLVYSKVTKIGKQLVSFAGGARYYVDTPPGGPDWGLRFVVTLLYPT